MAIVRQKEEFNPKDMGLTENQIQSLSSVKFLSPDPSTTSAKYNYFLLEVKKEEGLYSHSPSLMRKLKSAGKKMGIARILEFQNSQSSCIYKITLENEQLFKDNIKQLAETLSENTQPNKKIKTASDTEEAEPTRQFSDHSIHFLLSTPSTRKEEDEKDNVPTNKL